MKRLTISVYLIFILKNPNFCSSSILTTSAENPIAKILLANNLADANLRGMDIETGALDQVDQNSHNENLAMQACQLLQVVHLFHYPGCQTKAVISSACSGSCPSYVQVSKL